MKRNKYRLKGHQSFIPRDGWITKGINAVDADNRLYKTNSGADVLGVGTNMAKAIRYWMKTSGLTIDSSVKGVVLSDLGKLVRDFDVYLEDIFTLWVIHSNIVCNYEYATSWNMFFNHMELRTAFTREEMNNLMRSLIIEYTGDEDPSERSIRDDCAAILSMYGRGASPADDPEDKRISPFEELGLIEHVGNRYIKSRPAINKLDKMIILYLIIDKLNKDGSIQIDYLSDGDNMPGKVLNLSRITINDYLDSLQDENYIIVNRTAGLDIIYPRECRGLTSINVVQQYYEGGKG